VDQISKFKKFISSIAPGFLMVGYVIGTGSVTTMAVSGARFGMSLTWALLLSCLFTFIMLIAIGKLTIVTGQTILYNIKQHFGKIASLIFIVGLMVTVVSSISGVMGIMVEITQEFLIWISSSTVDSVIVAAFFLLGMLIIFWTGKHNAILNFMTLLVAMMALNFILSNFLIVQRPEAVIAGLVPSIPDVGEPHLVIAGMVGTTMAAVVLISRSSLIAESKWSIKELKKENKDALVAVAVTFIVSAAIMASAAGTLHVKGIQVENAIEMVHALRPMVGKFAMLVLLLGIISAGLSSIFPNIVLLPWLISDYNNKERNLRSISNRIIAIVVSLSGLLIPVFGGKPIAIMIASQAFSPLMMPLLIIFVIIMMNSKKVMGVYRNTLCVNLLLLLTHIFSIYISTIAMRGYLNYLNNII